MVPTWRGLTRLLAAASNPKFGDYQSNVALALAKRLGQQPRAIATQIVAQLAIDDFCQAPAIAGAGFINLTLKPEYLATRLQRIQADPRLGVALANPAKRTIVDYPSPNIAKEMHVGHLRPAVIGECFARVLGVFGARRNQN